VRVFQTSRNAITQEEVTSVINKTDALFVWSRHKTVSMYEITPTRFVFVISSPTAYERFEITTYAMAE
jgi:hypothetical protein